MAETGGRGRRRGSASKHGLTGSAIKHGLAGSAIKHGLAGSAIHRGLTGARELIGTRYLADPTLRREYDAEIAPRTGAALAKIFAELFPPDAAPPRRALDLGAGTGAAGVALRARFGEALAVVAVDRVAGPGIVVADLERGVPRVDGPFDIVVAAHVLNELHARAAFEDQVGARAGHVLAWARALLAPGGALVLVEPALRETSRALLAVRDRVVAAGLHVVAPCFFTGPCPALARERDWCHDAAARPSAARVDFSYLVLRASSPPVAPALRLRVVSDPLVEKGRLRIFACGARGREVIVRLDRDAAAPNADFDRLKRGDVVDIDVGSADERPPAADGRRLHAASVVTRRVRGA